jgi:hypothetical protein
MGFRNKLVSVLTAGLLTVSGAAAMTAVTAAPALAATCTTSNVNGNCGPYQDPTVFRTPNATDLVTQNDFSAIPQTLSAQDSTSWTVAASTAGQQDQTSVKSYPATQVTYTTTAGKPEPVSTFGSTLTSTYTNLEPSGTGQDYEYAVDDWLADPTKNSWTNDFEMMVWTDTHGQRPAGNDTGNVYTDAAGTQWEVWTNPGSTTVSNNVDIVSFVRKTNSVSGSLERIGFYNYLVSHGYLNTANFGIDQTNYGLEICSTGGATRTYGVSNYSLVVNGGGGQQNQAPVVSTNAASAVTDTTATLNGSVNPEGQSTSFQFDYGTDISYGTSVGSGSAGSGSSSVPESANLTGLLPSTTYHYRIEATNATGTTFGSDQTFTTSATGGGGGGSSVAFDAQTGGKKTGTAPLSLTLNVGTGSNRAILAESSVGVSNDVGCTQTLKLNGVAMTKLGVIHTNNQHAGFMDVWGAVAPPSGANTLSMSVSGCSSPTLTAVAESFTGVDQVTPFSALASAAGSGTSAHGSASSASASDMVAAFAAAGNSLQAPAAPAAHSLVENQNANTGAGNSASATAPGTGSSVTVAWPVSQSDWWATGLVDVHHA